MKINLAKSAGFCFGVKRALKIAEELAAKDLKIVMLGDIVHNNMVTKYIRDLGIKKISQISLGKNKTLLIRAHGTSLKTYAQAEKAGYKIADATCPMVKEIHKIAREGEKTGATIIIIGDKKHDEVQGIVGQLKTRSLIIDSREKVPFAKLKKIKKARIILQSTQNLERVMPLIEQIRAIIKDVEFVNTICNPTRIKQKEIKEMPKQNDVMIIIGSRESANTKRLYEISKSINKKSYWIDSEKDLKPEWFAQAKQVGISAGASTPDSVTKKVISAIKAFKV